MIEQLTLALPKTAEEARAADIERRLAAAEAVQRERGERIARLERVNEIEVDLATTLTMARTATDGATEKAYCVRLFHLADLHQEMVEALRERVNG